MMVDPCALILEHQNEEALVFFHRQNKPANFFLISILEVRFNIKENFNQKELTEIILLYNS